MDKTKFYMMIYHPPLREITDSTSAALFLGQLIYKANTTPVEKLSYGMICISAKEVYKDFHFGRSELERVNLILREKNLCIIKRRGVPATNHYLPNKKEIEKQLSVCGIPANWIAKILQTGLREFGKQDSGNPANINSNKEFKEKKNKEGGVSINLINSAEEAEKSPPPSFVPPNFGKGTPKGFAALEKVVKKNGNGKDIAEVAEFFNAKGFESLPNQEIIFADAVKTYGKDDMLDAMRIAIERDKKRWNYVRGILEKWRNNGKDTGEKNVNSTNKSGHAKNESGNRSATAAAAKRIVERKRKQEAEQREASM